MTAFAQPQLEPGRVYRTRDFAKWSANPPRYVKSLVAKGVLRPLNRGLFAHLKRGRFGEVPPHDEEVMRAFLDDGAFIFTGPDRWNPLGLGATAVFAMPLVYNTKRSGVFTLGGRKFKLQRKAFPPNPSPEWFVVDLLENADSVGLDRDELVPHLRLALQSGRFDRVRLLTMAKEFGTKSTLALVWSALQ